MPQKPGPWISVGIAVSQARGNGTFNLYSVHVIILGLPASELLFGVILRLLIVAPHVSIV